MTNQKPAADRLRPRSFDEMAGQNHLVGKNGVLRRLCESGRITSMIFFGPPGTGKTTAASIIAESSGMELRRLNATTCSLSDVKEICAETGSVFGGGAILLYLDEVGHIDGFIDLREAHTGLLTDTVRLHHFFDLLLRI